MQVVITAQVTLNGVTYPPSRKPVVLPGPVARCALSLGKAKPYAPGKAGGTDAPAH